MAALLNKKTSELTAITNAELATTDLLNLSDISAGTSKKLTIGEADNRWAGAAGNSFETISTPAGTSPVAESATDTLNLTSTDSTVTITGTEASDTVDFSVPAKAWTTFTPVINNGGTLTYTTANARYIIDGKLMLIHFDFTQTNPGTGTSDVTIDVPGGATVLDSQCAGVMIGFDIANNNVWKTFGVIADNATNKFLLTNTDTALLMRGGNFIGNNGNGWAVNLTVAIA